MSFLIRNEHCALTPFNSFDRETLPEAVDVNKYKKYTKYPSSYEMYNNGGNNEDATGTETIGMTQSMTENAFDRYCASNSVKDYSLEGGQQADNYSLSERSQMAHGSHHQNGTKPYSYFHVTEDKENSASGTPSTNSGMHLSSHNISMRGGRGRSDLEADPSHIQRSSSTRNF